MNTPTPVKTTIDLWQTLKDLPLVIKAWEAVGHDILAQQAESTPWMKSAGPLWIASRKANIAGSLQTLLQAYKNVNAQPKLVAADSDPDGDEEDIEDDSEDDDE